jgi:hypothetical protein
VSVKFVLATWWVPMQARFRGNATVASDTLRRGQRSRGTDLTNRVAAGCIPRRALRRLRPPEGISILPKTLALEHLALHMIARYKAARRENADERITIFRGCR